MNRHHKRLVLSALVGLGFTLPAFAFVYRDAIVERWNISRLSSTQKHKRLAAVKVLGEVGSPAALPHLFAYSRTHGWEITVAKDLENLVKDRKLADYIQKHPRSGLFC